MDLIIGNKIRQCRIMLGLTQTQLGNILEVSYQQLHKYETGTNRISASRLYEMAKALGTEITYFFPPDGEKQLSQLGSLQRGELELIRNFMAIADPRQKQVVSELARSLAGNAPAVNVPRIALRLVPPES